MVFSSLYQFAMLLSKRVNKEISSEKEASCSPREYIFPYTFNAKVSNIWPVEPCRPAHRVPRVAKNLMVGPCGMLPCQHTELIRQHGKPLEMLLPQLTPSQKSQDGAHWGLISVVVQQVTLKLTPAAPRANTMVQAAIEAIGVGAAAAGSRPGLWGQWAW